MAAQETNVTPAGLRVRRATVLAGLLALTLVASVFVVPRASALGQATLGFAEAGLSDVEQFQVMGSDYTVRTNLSFLPSELVRVNATSSTVDWTTNANGGGALDLVLTRFDGTTLRTLSFAEAAGGPPFVYSATLDLSTLTMPADWYYLRINIDDTVNTFQAMSPIRIGTPFLAHSIETFTDHTFSHPSDVFTPSSMMWVKVVGFGATDTDQWDLAQYLNGNSVVNGPTTNFENFQRIGTTYTFSIDLSQWTANLNQGWSYTLGVRLQGAAFDAGKQIQIFSPTVNVASSSLAPAQAAQGQTGVPILALTLSLNAGWNTILAPAAFNLDQLRVTRSGSGANADIAGVHLWQDVNGNAAVDAGDVLLASSTNTNGVAFPVWLGQNGATLAIVGSNAPLDLILTYDIAPAAAVGDTVGAQIAAASDVNLAGTFAAVTGLPAASGTVQVVGATVLTVTDNPGVAPGSATQGQSNVPIDLLRFATNGPSVTVSGLTMRLAGSGTPADVAQVSLHVDNGDNVYESAQDPVLGSPTAFSAAGVASLSGLGFAVTSAGRSVWIVYNLSSSATVGDQVGSSLASNASVAVGGGSVYNGTFPLDSGLTAIAGPTLTVTWKNLAPAQAIQGRTNLPMLALTLTLDFGQAAVTGFRIDKRGTSILDSDVPLAKIWLDNGDGLFDTGDLLLGSQGFVGGTTVIGGLSLTVSPAVPRTLFVTYDISATATTGVTVTARLFSPAYVSVDRNTTVSNANFPIGSAPVTINAPGTGAFLTIGSVDMAQWYPRVYEGQTAVPLEKLYLTVDQNSALITGMHVDKVGTSTLDSDIAVVKLYEDADGNGNFSLADRLLASSSFVTGIAIFGNLNIVVPVNEPVTLFLVIDVSPTATVGRTLGVHMGNTAYLAVNSTTTVDPNSFPIESSDVTVYAASLHGTVRDTSGKPIANATVFLPQLNRTTTTDANGNYAFANLPLGTWVVIARAPGYDEGNLSANLTSASPSGTLDFALSPTPGPSPSAAFLPIAIGGTLLALLAAGLILFALSRRRGRCPVCGKPKARDQEVCPECQAKGLHPPRSAPPGQPPAPPAPPSSPEPPRPSEEEL